MLQSEQAQKTNTVASHAKPNRRAASGWEGGIASPAFSNHTLQHLLQSRVIQAKLKISQPGDAYEQEADRVADTVMRMPEPATSGPTTLSNAADPTIQRACAECEDEVQRQAIGEEETDDVVPDETGMPKREPGASSPNTAEVANVQIPRDGGQPLSTGVRSFMEPRFGVDFSHVRVHTGEKAAESSRDLRASAYTVGRNIFFSAGEYQPGSFAGRKLLAHELTHVVQQTGQGKDLGVQRQRPARPAPPVCTNECAAGACPQGKQSRVIRNDCAESEPVNHDNYITALHVSLSGRTVKAMWWAGVGAAGFGYSQEWPCSPNPAVTPQHSAEHPDVVGKKCTIDHTNRHRDGMAWFTGFRSENLRIGFHNSQPVGPGCVSHGCVRVCCEAAEIINKNTWSRRTKIIVT